MLLVVKVSPNKSDQEVVPQARPQVPPRQEPQQRGGHQALR
jgi:hypothetical protein